MKTKIRLALIMSLFMSIIIAILIHHQSYIAAIVMDFILAVCIGILFTIETKKAKS